MSEGEKREKNNCKEKRDILRVTSVDERLVSLTLTAAVPEDNRD